MSKTRIRAELPEKYNESERKRGRSRTALYREDETDWVFIADIFKNENKANMYGLQERV